MLTSTGLRSSVPYLVCLLLMTLLFLLPDYLGNLLEYQRTDISQWQLWRLLTAHLLHINHWHLLMNAAALLLAVSLHGTYSRYLPFWWQFTFSALFISLAIYWFSPHMQHYVGLSGVLHALLTWGACVDIQQKQRTGWLLLAGLLIKVSYEQWQGPDPELEKLINASVAIDAHLYGVISGLLLWLLTVVLNNYQKQRFIDLNRS